MLRTPGEISGDEEAAQHFEELWQKILTEMEQTLDRENFDAQLFNDIHASFPEKWRKKRAEMWQRAKAMEQKDLWNEFDWKPSKSFFCDGKAMTVSEADSKSEYKYLKLENTAEPNEDSILCVPREKCSCNLCWDKSKKKF